MTRLDESNAFLVDYIAALAFERIKDIRISGLRFHFTDDLRGLALQDLEAGGEYLVRIVRTHNLPYKGGQYTVTLFSGPVAAAAIMAWKERLHKRKPTDRNRRLMARADADAVRRLEASEGVGLNGGKPYDCIQSWTAAHDTAQAVRGARRAKEEL
jgi:hypothetical protein